MHLLTPEDLEFQRQFATGELLPAAFDHRCHLRLAYIHIANHGYHSAASTFRAALTDYLCLHDIDAGKFHETLTQAWLQAVWYFMQRADHTASAAEFLHRSESLLDPRVMLTHYSRDVLFGDDARRAFVPPDLDPIPLRATP